MKSRKVQRTLEVVTLAPVLALGFAAPRLRGQAPQTPQAPQAPQAPRSEPMQIDVIESRARGTVILTPDPSVKYRLAGGGFIEHTTDGGATWNGQLVSPNARLIAGSAPSAKVCWVVGRDAAITLTKNGTDWQQVDPPVVTDFIAVAAKNDNTATVTTLGGKKYTTTDRGKKWKPVS
jgi:photosystem II stability/assembly factor-like uncharacterized protein